MQPGSSIMPGKVNPVIPELVNIVAFRVMGNDYAVPSPRIQASCSSTPTSRSKGWPSWSRSISSSTPRWPCAPQCVDGITVNEKVLAHYMETTVGIVTALNPVLGYEKATELANEAYKSDKGFSKSSARRSC